MISTPAPTASNPATQRDWLPILAALLVGLTLALYWPARNFDFISLDDPDYIGGNARVQAGLTAESIRWAFGGAQVSNYHPVTWLSHMLDCQLFGAKPGPHHVVSLCFHAANTLLLLLFLRRTTGQLWPSAVVAGLFAWHPLHVESVVWIAERKDVLSTFFGLLTLIAYVRYVEGARVQSPKSRVWYVAALVLFALGLLSKPMLVTWPCVLLLLDVWPLKRVSFSNGWPARKDCLRLAWEKVPFLALTVAFSVITVMAQRGSGATIALDALPLDARLANVVVSYGRYLANTFWPLKLGVFYPYERLGWDSLSVWFALALLAALTIYVLRTWRSQPYLAVGWFWFLGTLVPVIGLVQVGRQALADRYTYVPLIGLFVALVWWAVAEFERFKFPRGARLAAGGLVLAACALLTRQQLGHWRNTATLAAHTASVTQGNYLALTQLAGTLVEAGKLDEALAACRKALEFRPNFAEAHQTIAVIYARQGNLEDALAAHQEAARYDPTFPDPHHSMAEVCLKLGRFAEAETHSRETLRLAPLHMGAHFTLAQALHNLGRLDEAITAYEKLDALKPGLFSVQRGLGSLLALKGNAPAALIRFEAARKLQPENADILNSLGVLQLEQGQVDRASNNFAAAWRAQPTNMIANYQLAVLLSASRQPVAAINHYRVALQARPDWPEVLNNLAWLLAASADPAARNGAEAVRLAQRACALTGDKEPFLAGTLAAAYAEAGQFSEAVATAEKAINLARAAGQTNVVQANEKLLELYRAGKPFHEPQ